MLPLGALITFGISVITGIHGDVDIDYHEGPKIVGFTENFVYRAYYTPKNFDEAQSACQTNGNRSHLITITDSGIMTQVQHGLFDEDLLDDGSESFFWIGLRWENKSWNFEGGNPSSWDGPVTYNEWDDDPTPDIDHKHCVGLIFQARGIFKWHREDCATKKAPYICTELNKKCLPTVKTEDGTEQKMKVSLNNHGCSDFRQPEMDYVENDCLCNTTHEIRHALDGRVCDNDFYTTNTVCLPGCYVQQAPVPDNAILLDRDQVYHEGSRVAYYCPGIFEYHGSYHFHNLIELPCRANVDYSLTVPDLLCHANEDGQLKDVKTIHASLYYNYKLYCKHKGSPELRNAQSYIWYHGRRAISSETQDGTYKVNNNGDLEILNLNEEATGNYFCVAKYMNSFLPGNIYNITTEHNQARLDAIRKLNTYADGVYLGYFYDPNNKTYYKHIAYYEPKTFELARNSCESKAPGGRLALLSGFDSQKVLGNLFSPEMSPENYQFKDRPDNYPEKYWSGMVLSMLHHYEWMDISGQELENMLTWREQDEGAKHHGQCAAISLHLTESQRNFNDKVSMTSVNCAELLPYVCTFPVDQCFPPALDKTKSGGMNNYKCSNNTSQLVNLKTDGCECESGTRVDPENHQSCTGKEVWNTALCVPECEPNPEYGGIVYPEQKYYTGMYMTYFCPGHFEINGIEYNHNSLALRCNPSREDVVNLQCRREKLLSENAHVTIITLNLERLKADPKPIILECNASSYGLHNVVWMIKNEFNLDVWKEDTLKSVNGNVSLLAGRPSFSQGGNKLTIKHADESIRGVYGCFFDSKKDDKDKKAEDYVGILLPGNVYKIMFEGDEEEDGKETEGSSSTSSFPSMWQHTGICFHHMAMLLLLLVLRV